MPAYFFAQLNIHDPEGYQGYLKGFMPILERHKGRLLTVSSKPVDCVEGEWPEGGVVLMEFPDLETAYAWKNDPEYVELAHIRHATATTNAIIVDGI